MSDQPAGPPSPAEQAKQRVTKYVKEMPKEGQQQLLELAGDSRALGAAVGKQADGQGISGKVRDKLQALNARKPGVYFFDTKKSQYFEYRGGAYYQIAGVEARLTPMAPGFQPLAGPLPAIEGGIVKLMEFAAPAVSSIPPPKEIPGARFITPPKQLKPLVEESPGEALRRLRKLESLNDYDLFYNDGEFWATQDWKTFLRVSPETGKISAALRMLPPGKYNYLAPGTTELQIADWDPYKERKQQRALAEQQRELETRGSFGIGKDPYPLVCGGRQVEVNGEPVHVDEYAGYWRLTAGSANYVVVQGNTDHWVKLDPRSPELTLGRLSNVNYELYYDDTPLDLSGWQFRFGVIIPNWKSWTGVAGDTFLRTYKWGTSKGMIHVPFRTDKYTMHASVENTYFGQCIAKILESGQKPWRGCMSDLAGSVHHLTIEFRGHGSAENPRLFPTGKTWIYTGDEAEKALPKPLLGPDAYFKQAREYLKDWGP